MIISHRHRFIFLKTKKSAGTSVELALTTICGPQDVITGLSAADEAFRSGLKPQNNHIAPDKWPGLWRLYTAVGLRPSKAGLRFYEHMTAAELRPLIGSDIFDAYRKITIVRNPWDREVSLYFWHYRTQPNPPSFGTFVRRPRWRPDRKNFELYAIGGRPVADVYLRYERLAEDFRDFVATLDADKIPELPQAKAGERPTAKRDYRQFYTPYTQSIVARRYAREIALFGYDFG